jgi:hypothetical protein
VLRVVYPADAAADAAFKRLLRSSIESGEYFEIYYKVYKERPPYESLARLLN